MAGGRTSLDAPTRELELKEDGTFSYQGTWSGYELTMVSGTWSQRDGYVHLTGTGSMRADFGRFSDRAFDATFSRREDGAVVSETGAPGWSLLDTREPLWPVASEGAG
jgi:hypothetical protein